MGRILPGLLVLIFTSPIDFPLMLIGGERWPHRPEPIGIESDGSFYHHGKGFWATALRRASAWLRADSEWWAKLIRFVVWWLTAFIIYGVL